MTNQQKALKDIDAVFVNFQKQVLQARLQYHKKIDAIIKHIDDHNLAKARKKINQL